MAAKGSILAPLRATLPRRQDVAERLAPDAMLSPFLVLLRVPAAALAREAARYGIR